MTKSDVIDLMAWTSMAILAIALAVAVVGLLVRFGPLSLPARAGTIVRHVSLPAAAAVAIAATASSLWLSEVANFIPCDYCWYQRIAMYPLAVILPIAALLRDVRVWRYGLPVALIGAATSAYHYWLQVRPDDGPSACTVGVPCSVRYVDELSVVSIPWMAGWSFVLIAVLIVVARLVEGSGSGQD